jgi:hypothetical protein
MIGANRIGQRPLSGVWREAVGNSVGKVRWIGWIEEVPGVNCQERTREEMLETLRITLAEMVEGAP